MTEVMAKTAAHNIAADIDGAKRATLPLEDLGAICILDAGNNGVIFKAEHMLARNGHANGQVELTESPAERDRRGDRTRACGWGEGRSLYGSANA